MDGIARQDGDGSQPATPAVVCKGHHDHHQSASSSLAAAVDVEAEAGHAGSTRHRPCDREPHPAGSPRRCCPSAPRRCSAAAVAPPDPAPSSRPLQANKKGEKDVESV